MSATGGDTPPPQLPQPPLLGALLPPLALLLSDVLPLRILPLWMSPPLLALLLLVVLVFRVPLGALLPPLGALLPPRALLLSDVLPLRILPLRVSPPLVVPLLVVLLLPLLVFRVPLGAATAGASVVVGEELF